MGRLVKLAESEVEQARSFYDAGESTATIAGRFGVSRQAMWELLKSRGVKMRPRLRSGSGNQFYRGGPSDDDDAQNKLEYALRAGTVVKNDSCEKCGSTARFRDGRSGIQAHHDDYNKPLDVRWLCKRCHHDWHSQNRAIARVHR